MLSLNDIKERIEKGLVGALVEILDPRRDGVHLKAVVVYAGFVGKTLVEQHQMVYGTISDLLASGELHALAIETKVE
tara:strand:+ start:570 stop:800 length:231 start_codon:yes stop_codon:yes gene_type:complete